MEDKLERIAYNAYLKDGKLHIESPPVHYKLVRERDNLTKISADVAWIEYNDDGTFKKKYKNPKIGRSLLMSPFNIHFTWNTTPVTEIVSKTSAKLKFKTGNSTYTLTKI